MEVIWKNVRGFEGIYAVSNTGEVRAKDRKIKIRDFERAVKGHVMKLYDDQHGYCLVDLYKHNIRTKCKVHRLVMEAFSPIANSDELDVNHIDGNKKNNNLSNLEWCTRRENLIHAVNMGLMAQRRAIVAYKDGEEFSADSITGLYDVLNEKEKFECSVSTFRMKVSNAMKAGTSCCGYTFREVQSCVKKKNRTSRSANNGIMTSQCIKLTAYKDGKEYHSNSIYSMYDILKDIENIKCKRKTFGGNVWRAIQTGGIYYGYRFQKEGD